MKIDFCKVRTKYFMLWHTFLYKKTIGKVFINKRIKYWNHRKCGYAKNHQKKIHSVSKCIIVYL